MDKHENDHLRLRQRIADRLGRLYLAGIAAPVLLTLFSLITESVFFAGGWAIIAYFPVGLLFWFIGSCAAILLFLLSAILSYVIIRGFESRDWVPAFVHWLISFCVTSLVLHVAVFSFVSFEQEASYSINLVLFFLFLWPSFRDASTLKAKEPAADVDSMN